MFTVTQQETIDRPIGVVFAFLSRFENRPQFESAVVEATLVHGDIVAEGAKYREVRKIMGIPTTTVHEITRYEPPALLTFKSVAGPIPLEGRYDLEDESGRTRVLFSLTMRPRGVMRLFQKVISSRTKKDLTSYYRTLKEVLERAAPG